MLEATDPDSQVKQDIFDSQGENLIDGNSVSGILTRKGKVNHTISFILDSVCQKLLLTKMVMSHHRIFLRNVNLRLVVLTEGCIELVDKLHRLSAYHEKKTQIWNTSLLGDQFLDPSLSHSN